MAARAVGVAGAQRKAVFEIDNFTQRRSTCERVHTLQSTGELTGDPVPAPNGKNL